MLRLHNIIQKAIDELPDKSFVRSAFKKHNEYPELSSYNTLVFECVKGSSFDLKTQVLLLDLLTVHCAQKPYMATNTMVMLNDNVKRIAGLNTTD